MSALHRKSDLATISGHEHFQAVDARLLRQKATDAARNPRLREIHILHAGDEDPMHRMLNALQPGTYARPHRHLHPPKSEGFVILQGSAGVVVFDQTPDGIREERVLLDRERGDFAVDVRAGVWHTILALAPDTVIYEVKPGPYAPATDKDFAPWAPPADSVDAAKYLRELEERFRAAFGLT
ncbi:WbuC family cupin fold metalloprotein [Desulfonatronum parangueonense]